MPYSFLNKVKTQVMDWLGFLPEGEDNKPESGIVDPDPVTNIKILKMEARDVDPKEVKKDEEAKSR